MYYIIKHMKTLIRYISFFILLLGPLAAQMNGKIEGVISDQITSKPLPYANVLIDMNMNFDMYGSVISNISNPDLNIDKVGCFNVISGGNVMSNLLQLLMRLIQQDNILENLVHQA